MSWETGVPSPKFGYTARWLVGSTKISQTVSGLLLFEVEVALGAHAARLERQRAQLAGAEARVLRALVLHHEHLYAVDER